MTDNAKHHRRTGLTAVAALALIGLAACQSSDTETAAAAQPGATAESAAATTGADTQTAQAAPAGAGGDETRLTTVDCKAPSHGKVYFGVGGTVMAVPANEILTVYPPNVAPNTPAADVVNMLKTQTAAGAGCPDKPLDAGLLAVAGQTADPLLEGRVIMVRAQPGTIAKSEGKVAREMQQNASKCQKTKGGLLACNATVSMGDTQVHRLYFVSANPKQTLSYGGPLAAYCSVNEEQKKLTSCEILDELPGNIAVRAPLKAVPQSPAQLQAAQKAMVARVRELRA